MVRVVECLELMSDELEGFVPADGLVVLLAFPQDHRLSQPALLVMPVVAFFEQFADTVFGKEATINAAGGGLRGYCFGTIFTKLGNCPVVIRIGPGAAWAVKSIELVEI